MRTAPAHDRRSIDQAAARYEAEAAQWAAAGQHDHAARLYAATLDHRPGDTRVRMMLAGCLARSSQPAAAAGEYLRVALDYAAQRRDREALALAYQVLHLDASQLVYVAVAEALRGIGHPARELCARAAEAHLQAGRLVDGLHMLQLGAEIDARNADVRRRLAQLYLSQHMTGPAVANLAEAGRLLLAAGNNAEYVEVAEQILRVDPRHLETLRELPRVYLRVGEPQRAVVKLADLMRASPGDAVGYETLAHAFAVIGRVPTALSVLERLVGELVATGRAPQAEAMLERARGWRHDDGDFAQAVLALREPDAMARAPRIPRTSDPELQAGAEASPRTADEGTVVLDITDLLTSGDIAAAVAAHRRPGRSSASRPTGRPALPPAPEAVLDLSEDMVELDDMVELQGMELDDMVELDDMELDDMEPADTVEPEDTMELDDMVELEEAEIMLVHPLDALGDVTALVVDEGSAELRQDPRSPAARAAMVRRARELARHACA